jgi:hydrogenase maturation protease
MDDRPSDASPSSMVNGPSSVLVLGLGNPILGDDGVGWRVVEAVQEEWERRSDEGSTLNDGTSSSIVHRPLSVIEFDYFALGGLALMERLVGYGRAVLVDAIQTQGGEPGAIYWLALDDLPTLHANSTHDTSLKAALTLGRRLGAKLPDSIAICAIEAANVLDFSESLSSPVAASVEPAARMVLAELANSC